jgi:uncharacterized protein
MFGSLQCKKIDLVVKITKFCNLRCSYCYEYPYLSNREVISIENMSRLLSNFTSSLNLPNIGCRANFPTDRSSIPSDIAELNFIWHGGEPFMVPIGHYDEIGKLQKLILDPLVYQNFVQTNLTILTDRHIEWIRSGIFFSNKSVGFSFDVYGDQRCDIRGRDASGKVLKNLQLLIDNKITSSGITVLSRSTAPNVRNIFQFYNDLGLDFRLLPYHLETNPEQTKINGVSVNEIAASMCELFDLWCLSEEPITVAPLNEYVEDAIAFVNNKKTFYYDKKIDESIFIVDTDGSVHGHEVYGTQHAYGNLFEQPFEEILCSESRRRTVARAALRMDNYCVKCKFFGACSGFPVAEANPMEEQWLLSSGCYVAKILDHIVDRLDKAGMGRAPSGKRPDPPFIN